MNIKLHNKSPEGQIKNVQNMPLSSRELQLVGQVDTGWGSYGENRQYNTLILRNSVTQMDHLCTKIANSEKIDLEKFKTMQAPFYQKLQALFNSRQLSKLQTYQSDPTVHQGMQGLIDNSMIKLPLANRVGDQICDDLKKETAPYAGRIGTLVTVNAESGGMGTGPGKMFEFKIKYNFKRDIDILSTVLPSPRDGTKFGNRQITFAFDLLNDCTDTDVVLFQDNSIISHHRSHEMIDFKDVAAWEGLRKGKSITGKSDYSDRIAHLRDSGNKIVMAAAATVTMATQKRFLRSKGIDPRITSEVVSQTLTELSTQKGFEKYGHMKARCVKPNYLGIYGAIPETILHEAVDSADIDPNLNVLYLPTQIFGDDLLIFGLYTTKYSIDSFDTFFGLPLNGVRKAEKFEELIPRDILEDFASRTFPNSRNGTDYLTVIRRIAKICDVDVEEVIRTV